jgi:hypothetical protein
MSSELVNTNQQDLLQRSILEAEIAMLKKQLEEIKQKTWHFEVSIRNSLSDEMLEIQELTVLYKSLKKNKKEKRLAQKQKGKKFIKQEGVEVQVAKSLEIKEKTADYKELRRIYKEAMWLVHPDMFAMQEDMEEQATILTQQLVEIYQSGNLEHLKAFSAQLSNQAKSNLKFGFPKLDTLEILLVEKNNLTKALEAAMSEHFYKILLEYGNPVDYIQELKTYFDDKLIKLRKRTRKS